MWLAILTIFAITTTTIITCDLISLDNIWASTSAFHRDHGYALIDHVIKTLPLFIADCLAACQGMLRCFSVNYINFHNGTFICELNWSTKKQSQDSFVRKEGNEYAEPPNFLHCEGRSCAQKEAQRNDWFKFNSSRFKIFYDKRSWRKAKEHCKIFGGDLASFGSHTEQRFVQKIMFYHEFNFLISTDIKKFNLHGAAVVIKDNRKAIHFNGINGAYVTIPRFDIHITDFTIAFWYKAEQSVKQILLVNRVRYSAARQFVIFIAPTSNMEFHFYNTDENGLVEGLYLKASEIPKEKWHHLTVTWSRQAKQFKLYLNALLKKSLNSTNQSNVDLYDTGRSEYAIGGRADGQFLFKGWMSELVAFPQELKQKEVENLKDGRYFGAWIGLNDIDEEGTPKWSNKQPLTYRFHIQNQDTDRDCGYLAKEGSTFIWRVESCDLEYPFICEKS